MAARKADEFMIIAHRGASKYEPENTFASFDKAVEIGARVIEFDVRLSMDNKLVCIHDSKVNRTTDGKGKVRNKTAAELKTLDAGNGNRIPLIEEIFSKYANKIMFVIELKDYNTEEGIIDLIHEYNAMDNIFVVSFSKRILKRVKFLEPAITTGLIKFLPTGIAKDCRDCGADVIAVFRYFITRKLVAKTKADGLHLFAWTVNDPIQCRQFRKMGLTGVVTDRPDILM